MVIAEEKEFVEDELKWSERPHRLSHRYLVVKKLGQGTYGKVQLALNKETNQEVAIKTIKKAKIENAEDMLRIRREIHIMTAIRHPHIIHIHEVFETKQKIVLVMQYASGGELYDYLGCHQMLPEDEARRIFRQIASAIYYCHKKQICHRDLKLENILLDEHGNAQIADFGLSNIFDGDKRLTTFCGSPLYASPEIVKGTPYRGPEVDCWSLGVLLYTLIYGTMPFDGRNFKELVSQISAGQYKEPVDKSKASGLIRNLLMPDVSERATIVDICKDSWVNQGYDHSLLEIAEKMANTAEILYDEVNGSRNGLQSFTLNGLKCDSNTKFANNNYNSIEHYKNLLKPNLNGENCCNNDQETYIPPVNKLGQLSYSGTVLQTHKPLLYEQIIYYDVEFIINKLISNVEKLEQISNLECSNNTHTGVLSSLTDKAKSPNMKSQKNGIAKRIENNEPVYVIPIIEVTSVMPNLKEKSLYSSLIKDDKSCMYKKKPLFNNQPLNDNLKLNNQSSTEMLKAKKELNSSHKCLLNSSQNEKENIKQENQLNIKKNIKNQQFSKISLSQNTSKAFTNNKDIQNLQVYQPVKASGAIKNPLACDAKPNNKQEKKTSEPIMAKRNRGLCRARILCYNFEILAKTSRKTPNCNRRIPGKITIPPTFNPANSTRTAKAKNKIIFYPTVSVSENKEKIEKQIERVRKASINMAVIKRANSSKMAKIQMFLQAHAMKMKALNDEKDAENSNQDKSGGRKVFHSPECISSCREKNKSQNLLNKKDMLITECICSKSEEKLKNKFDLEEFRSENASTSSMRKLLQACYETNRRYLARNKKNRLLLASSAEAELSSSLISKNILFYNSCSNIIKFEGDERSPQNGSMYLGSELNVINSHATLFRSASDSNQACEIFATKNDLTDIYSDVQYPIYDYRKWSLNAEKSSHIEYTDMTQNVHPTTNGITKKQEITDNSENFCHSYNSVLSSTNSLDSDYLHENNNDIFDEREFRFDSESPLKKSTKNIYDHINVKNFNKLRNGYIQQENIGGIMDMLDSHILEMYQSSKINEDISFLSKKKKNDKKYHRIWNNKHKKNALINKYFWKLCDKNLCSTFGRTFIHSMSDSNLNLRKSKINEISKHVKTHKRSKSTSNLTDKRQDFPESLSFNSLMSSSASLFDGQTLVYPKRKTSTILYQDENGMKNYSNYSIGQSRSISEELLSTTKQFLLEMDLKYSKDFERRLSLGQKSNNGIVKDPQFFASLLENSNKNFNIKPRKKISTPNPLKNKPIIRSKSVPKNHFNSALQMTSLKRIQEANKELKEKTMTHAEFEENCCGPLLEALKTHGYKNVISQRFQHEEPNEFDFYPPTYLPTSFGTDIIDDDLDLTLPRYDLFHRFYRNTHNLNEFDDSYISNDYLGNGYLPYNVTNWNNSVPYYKPHFSQPYMQNNYVMGGNILPQVIHKSKPKSFSPMKNLHKYVNFANEEEYSNFGNNLNIYKQPTEQIPESRISKTCTENDFEEREYVVENSKQENRNKFDKKQLFSDFTNDQDDKEESVSDRIWRKSFYSRFNNSTLSRKERSSYIDPELLAEYRNSDVSDIASPVINDLRLSYLTKDLNFRSLYHHKGHSIKKSSSSVDSILSGNSGKSKHKKSPPLNEHQREDMLNGDVLQQDDPYALSNEQIDHGP